MYSIHINVYVMNYETYGIYKTTILGLIYSSSYDITHGFVLLKRMLTLIHI